MSFGMSMCVCVVLFIVCRRCRCRRRHTRSLPHAPINPANMCINLYSMEAVLFQLLSIKNAFDFAFTSTFKIGIKIEIECFLIGICKCSLCLLLAFYTVYHSRFPGNFAALYPPLALSGSLSLSIAITDCFLYAFLSRSLSVNICHPWEILNGKHIQ